MQCPIFRNFSEVFSELNDLEKSIFISSFVATLDVITTDQRTLTITMFGDVIKTVVGEEEDIARIKYKILALQDFEITLNTKEMVIDAMKY